MSRHAILSVIAILKLGAFCFERRIPSALLAISLLMHTAWAAVTVDGHNSPAENYAATANNTNTFFGGGVSAKSEEMFAQSDGSNLYVFIEGSLNNTNYVYVLIDSDATSSTGFSGPHPNGSSSESNGLEFFNDFPDGGYDLTIGFRAGASGNPTDFQFYVISYNGGGAIVDDLALGNSSGTTDSLSATVRGQLGNLQGGLISGDGPDDGVELGIPGTWLLNFGTGSLRMMCINGNGTNTGWFDSVIPQLASSGNIGFTPGPDQDRLTALTAPGWPWPAAAVTDWNFY